LGTGYELDGFVPVCVGIFMVCYDGDKKMQIGVYGTFSGQFGFITRTQRPSNRVVGIPHEPEWDPDPNGVHEDEVYPEGPGIRGIEVGAPGDPFRTESHPPAIELGGRQHDDPEVPRGVVPNQLADNVAA